MATDLWSNSDVKVSDLDIDVPHWIEQDITCGDVAAIVQGGCASGAYMPAVTYCDAREIMGDHGDDVLQFIEDALGELPKPEDSSSWSGIAVHYLSIAVELWASSVEGDIEDALQEREDERSQEGEA